MLKIRKDFDLKQLENYGFKKDGWSITSYTLTYYTGFDSFVKLNVTDDKNRNLLIFVYEEDTIPDSIQDIIYDLIVNGILIKED